jgi:hypothetical protein
MLNRCTSPRAERFDRYGGRGIVVCGRWASSFDAFLADMGQRPPGHTLDRIDVNGNYEPGNCRWADDKTQQRNRSRHRLLTFNGETATASTWAERVGVPWATILKRLERGWSLHDALDPAREVHRRVSASEDAEMKRLRATGLSEREIAKRLGVSPSVVHGHVSGVRHG